MNLEFLRINIYFYLIFSINYNTLFQQNLIDQTRKHVVDKTGNPNSPMDENKVLILIQLDDSQANEESIIARDQFLEGVKKNDGNPNAIVFLNVQK